jgi:imidazolonepropionase-like amidohydrolase
MSALMAAWRRAAVAFIAVSAIPGLAASAAAQAPTPPPHFAITNARIVTVPGRTIERGTVVMHDGLIAAVGADVQVPAGAWVIDGAGLTVYPGLVDAMSSVTLASDLRRPRGGGGGGGGSQGGEGAASHSWGPEDRPGTFTWVSAADAPNAGDEAVAAWRSAGFTSVVVAPERGFFPGQTAVINLAGERGRDMVVATPVAQRVNFQPGPGFPGYPGALFGAIAYVKQVFSDVAHYDRAWTLYESSPAGRERPTFDRTLEPLRYTLRTNQPVLYPGNMDKEIRRVFDIAAATNTTPIVYGAQEGYRSAGYLAERRATVLVNADWPERDENADPEADVALSTLRFRDRAPTTPAELQRAGVRFAFYSGGAEPAKLMRNLRKSVTLGLSTDAALRALTLTPAEIFGVANRLGSIEVGKIANVVVTDGDLFGDSVKIKMVFVDGRKYEPAAEAVASRGGRGSRGEQGEQAEGDTAQATEPQDVQPPLPMTDDRGPISTDGVVLIRNATIMTAANGTIENGSVLMRDGKIAAVGANLQAPRDATVIDATGKYVIPGIIDAHSHIATDAVNEGSVAVSAMVGIRDVIDPDDISIYRALAGGVTTINILHGSANPIGGKNAVIKLRWGADAAGLLFDAAPPGIKFALGENTKRDRNPDRYPATRMGVQDVIRQAFVEAQRYQREWDAFNALNDRQQRNTIPPRRDLKLEALAEILRGERLVHAHSYRADEILQLVRLADQFGFRIATFQHVLEGYKVADEIAAHGAGASTFSDWWAYKVEAYDAIPHNAALMTDRGVVASINSDSGEEMRHLNQEAAKAMHWGGLSETEALKLVTLNPAIQLGVSDRVGSIEVGKDADVVIYSGHPLSVFGVVEKTFVDGRLYFDREHDRQLHEQLQQEKKALLDKELGRTERPRVTTDAEGI